MPAVSVVIPVYKAERYVGAAMQSVLDQTFTDFEVIAVDDGSPDGSFTVLERFSDPRLRIVRQENRGLAGARNTGIREARGEIIGLLDADDLWMPRKLELHIAHLHSNPAVGVSFCHSALIDDDGRPLGKAQRPRAGVVSAERLLLNNPLSNGSTAVIRRRTLEEIASQGQYFDEALRSTQGTEDLDCWLRIALGTEWQIACLPEILTSYRLNSAGLSADGRQMVRSWERVIEKARSYAPAVIAEHERPARARLLRYLAGRAVRGRQPRAAWGLLRDALRTDPSLIWKQTKPTFLTALAVTASRLYSLFASSGQGGADAREIRS